MKPERARLESLPDRDIVHPRQFRRPEPIVPVSVNCKLTGDYARIWRVIQEHVESSISITDLLKDAIRLLGFVLYQRSHGRSIKTVVVEEGEEVEVEITEYLNLVKPIRVKKP